MYKHISYHPEYLETPNIISVKSFDMILSNLISTKSEDYIRLSKEKKAYLHRLLDNIFRIPNVLVASLLYERKQNRTVDLEESIHDRVISNVSAIASNGIIILANLVIDPEKDKMFLDSVEYENHQEFCKLVKSKINILNRIETIDEVLKDLD